MNRLLVFSTLTMLTACTDDSFAVVSVFTYAGTLDQGAQFRVHAKNASSEDMFLYPKTPSKTPSKSLHLDTDHPVSFSVEFDASRSGEASFEVEVLSASGTVLAYGQSTARLKPHGITPVQVKVVSGTVRPSHPQSGSSSEDLSCNPYSPADACGAERTCGVLCTLGKPAVGMCYAAGARQPGDSCTGNGDCGPGSQCFTFTATGCNVMTCLRFCQNDLACGQTGAFCNVPIQCGSTPPFAACSRPCDPSLATNNGCAAGLSCFVYSGQTTDCACPGLGVTGTACTQNSGCNGEVGCSGCNAGLSCVIPTGTDAGTGTGICRPVCKLGMPACPSGTTCHPFDNASRQLYGFCQ